MDNFIVDINLAEAGKKAVLFSLRDMPGITEIEKMYSGQKPLEGVKITGCVIVTYETAALIMLLKKLGAIVRWSSDNKYASLDDACAYIASEGVPIFASSNLTDDEFFWCMEKAAKFPTEDGQYQWPDIIIDDGCDITKFLHEKFPQAYEHIIVTCEQTTCGINSDYKLKNLDKLMTPIINISESVTKSKFDNIYGSRESLIEGIQSSVNVQIGGKKVVVYGYGEVGKGCAKAMRGLGANVSIVEIDPIVAMQAYMEGFDVLSRWDAATSGEIFITATGCIKTVDECDVALMKDGSILMNMGHGNNEINTEFLLRSGKYRIEDASQYCKQIWIDDNKSIYLLTNGYLINLVGGNGHPPRVMSITYTNHVLAIIDAINNPMKYHKGIHMMPRLLDERAALLNFPNLKNVLSLLSEEQEAYLGIGKCGPFKRDDYKY